MNEAIRIDTAEAAPSLERADAAPPVISQPSVLKHAVYVIGENPVTGLAFGLFLLITVCAIFGPLAQLKLIPAYGLAATFQILGAIFLVMTLIGAFLLKNPPAGYRPAGWSPRQCPAGSRRSAPPPGPTRCSPPVTSPRPGTAPSWRSPPARSWR